MRGARHRVASVAARVIDAHQTLRWGLLWTSAGWLVRPKYLVLAKQLSLPLPEVPISPLTHWTVLAEPETAAICAINARMTPADIQRRLAEGQECHLGWIGPDLAHYRWEITRPSYLPYLGKTVRPEAGQVYADDDYTARRFRRQGIHAAAATLALHRMQRRGLRQVLGIIAWWNEPSLRVVRDKMGYRVVGAIGAWRIGRWQHEFSEGAVRFATPTSFRVSA